MAALEVHISTDCHAFSVETCRNKNSEKQGLIKIGLAWTHRATQGSNPSDGKDEVSKIRANALNSENKISHKNTEDCCKKGELFW